MRFIALAIVLAISVESIGHSKNPLLSLNPDKVIICDFENDGEHDLPLLNAKGQWTNIVKKNVQLDRSTATKLVSMLGDRCLMVSHMRSASNHISELSFLKTAKMWQRLKVVLYLKMILPAVFCIRTSIVEEILTVSERGRLVSNSNDAMA
jgi:hypothetical protein